MRFACTHSDSAVNIMCENCYKSHIIDMIKIERIELILRRLFAGPILDKKRDYIKILTALYDISDALDGDTEEIQK